MGTTVNRILVMPSIALRSSGTSTNPSQTRVPAVTTKHWPRRHRKSRWGDIQTQHLTFDMLPRIQKRVGFWLLTLMRTITLNKMPVVEGSYRASDMNRLRQYPDANVFEFDRCAFGFECDESCRWLAVVSACNFMTVDPQSDFAVNGPDVIMIPMVEALRMVG